MQEQFTNKKHTQSADMHNTESISSESTAITDASEASYEDLVYPSKPFRHSHVAHLEATAQIYGLTPPPAETARVLEIGCSFGGNLITQALHFPNASFTGIDLSASQIEKGKEIVEAMGFTNVNLVQKNILHIDEDFGTFDYIIVHGIFSWVPDVVKDKILSICHTNLSPKGVALISYNTQPGWKDRSTLRDIFFFANQYTQDLPLLEQVHRGKAVLKSITDAIETNPNYKARQANLLETANSLSAHQDYYLGHEYLETFNDPMYLQDFIKQAESHQLAYVGNSALTLSFISAQSNSVEQAIKALAPNDHIIQEQCLDFIASSTFRQSILCHQSQAEHIDRSETFYKHILNKFNFEVRDYESFLALTEKSPLIHEALTHLLSNYLPCTPLNCLEYIHEHFKKEGKEPPKEEMDSLEQNVYLAFVIGVLNNYLVYGTHSKPLVDYKEGSTYIPERFCHYVSTLTSQEYSPYIMIGSRLNEHITDISNIDAMIMPFFTKEATKDEIIENITKLELVRTNADGEVIAQVTGEEYFPTVCQRYRFLGYFQEIE